AVHGLERLGRRPACKQRPQGGRTVLTCKRVALCVEEGGREVMMMQVDAGHGSRRLPKRNMACKRGAGADRCGPSEGITPGQVPTFSRLFLLHVNFLPFASIGWIAAPV